MIVHDNYNWDLFISHASEDKDDIARPLKKYFDRLGLNSWYDEDSIQFNESISKKVYEGLKKSKGAVIILSEKFYNKEWTLLELGGILYKRFNEGGILYLLYWDIEIKKVTDKLSFIKDIKSIQMSDYKSLEEVADNIYDDFKRKERNLTKEIHMPNIEPFDTSKDFYNILILPFRNPDSEYSITNLGRVLSDGLIEKNNLQKLRLDIKYLSSHTNIITTEEAKKLGENYNADIVIWGNDSKLEGLFPHRVYFHYVNITEDVHLEKLSLEGKTEKFETERLIELSEGDLHLEIEDIIYLFLGNKFYSKKDYKNALTIFKKIENVKYLNEDLFTINAICCHNLDLFNEAKEYYEKALKINPNSFVSHYGCASILKDSDKEEAKNHYKKVLEIAPNLAFVHRDYASLVNNKEEAKKHFKKSLEIDENDAITHNNYAILLKVKYNNKEEAKKHFEKALEIAPYSASIRCNYACLLRKSDSDKESAKKHFELALEIDNNDANLQYSYALLLKEDFFDKKGAKKHYLKAIKINPKFKTKNRHTYFGVKKYFTFFSLIEFFFLKRN